MKVLFVVSGTKRMAATRYRVYQYLGFLKKEKIEYDIFSITSDPVTKMAIRSPEFNTIKRFGYYLIFSAERFLRFWAVFFKAPRYDALFMQRATFPFGLAGLLAGRCKRIIFDIDDAIFMPDVPVNGFVSRLKAFVKEREVRDSLAVASRVIVENDYIKDYVSRFCGYIEKIPGPIDTDRYTVKEPPMSLRGPKLRPEAILSKEIVLGWIGSPSTTAYLNILNDVFPKIFSKYKNVRVVYIGAGKYGFRSERITNKDWNYDTEVEELRKFDIGLMPMPDDRWTRGKLGCKMLQYMAVGVPTLASYTPTNAEIIKDGENGFLPKTGRDWVEKLSLLIDDGNLRRRIGMAGRKTVEGFCSVRGNAPRFIKTFSNI